MHQALTILARPLFPAVLALISLLSGCGPDQPLPDVLLITVDTLRADRLGCYGWARAETPVIDALAGQGTLFEAAETTLPRTTQAFASLFTGQHVRRHGVLEIGEYLSLDALTLAERLSAAGYETAGISSNLLAGPFQGLHQGFDFFVDATELGRRFGQEGGLPERATDAAAVTAAGLAWLAEARQGPRFLWIHYTDPHFRYRPPPPWGREQAETARAFYERIETFVPKTATVIFDLNGESSRVSDAMRELYDGEISFTDREIGRFLQAWKEVRGEEDPGILIFTADHGESLGEHGYFYEHGDFVYEASTHIPLIWSWPGRIPAGRRVSTATSLVDLAPTLLGLLGIAPFGDGQDLSGFLLGEQGAVPPGDVVFAESGSALRAQNPRRQFCGRRRSGGMGESPFRSLRLGEWLLLQEDGAPARLFRPARDPALRENLGSLYPERVAAMLTELEGRGVLEGRWSMVREGDWKLIRQQRVGGPVDELFDLARDPGETHDLSTQNPGVVTRLAGHLDAWEGDRGSTPAPERDAARDAEVERQLRTLGYID